MLTDPLRDMALFVEVARARSFTRAAGKLDMPISSLSRRIGELEESIGLKLFSRTTRRVDLTEAGALYLARCESLVESAREAHEQVRGLVDNPEGVLRISAEPDIGPRLLAPCIARYLDRFPRVRVELDLSPRRVDLMGENFDLALRLGRLPDSPLTVRRIALLHSGLFASPEYLARRGVPGHPDDLAQHARIALLHQGDGGEWLLAKGEETTEVRTKPFVATNNMSVIRQFAALGVGIALVDRFLASQEVGSGALHPVLADWTLPPVPVTAVTQTRILPAKTRLFLEMLTKDIARVAGLAG